MTHTITLEKHQFEGPLDLLLTLIEEQKLNITDIALAQVTEQFLQYVRELEELDPTSLSDFLAIAAKLLVIKSKAILPPATPEAQACPKVETEKPTGFLWVSVNGVETRTGVEQDEALYATLRGSHSP
jgi:chromatin segregation and condensation protein Rec8/ScpA/Scc1 (kleisin family)